MEKRPICISLKTGIIILIIITFLVIATMAVTIINTKKNPSNNIAKVDDWEFDAEKISNESGGFFKSYSKSTAPSTFAFDSGAVASESINGGNIGFSTGGAKDINNFRENIKNGYFPITTDITYNGLFYDYIFDTGAQKESKELFSPSYSTAISKDPISGKNEVYMTVGLNSNIKQSDFKRKKLNLVVVLDISGSMDSGLNSYYYDQFTGKEKKEQENNEDENKTKMQIANESVNVLIDQLKDDDRFGMVLFDNSAYLGKPISLVKNTDISAIKKHILEIEANGGTNFEAGYTKATELFKEYLNVNSYEYENRIIVITDAMPNYGETSDEGLMKYVKENAEKGIYTSFIGVGVDFNTELTEAISDVKGANYYSVHSSKEFKNRMGDEFEYMVTPLVFDLELNSEDFEIAKVYGSDTANKESGNLMNVNTLFPTKTTEEGEVKGGIILLKLRKKNEKTVGNVNLSVSYKDRNGKEFSNSQDVPFGTQEEHYDNTGIRKAIVLTRYANVVKNWIMYERTGEQRFIIIPAIGILDFDYTEDQIVVMLGRNERTSVKLKVSDTYKSAFNTIKQYILNENNELKDDNFKQEIEILDLLTK